MESGIVNALLFFIHFPRLPIFSHCWRQDIDIMRLTLLIFINRELMISHKPTIMFVAIYHFRTYFYYYYNSNTCWTIWASKFGLSCSGDSD